jgi:hypothetical protein
LRIMSRQDLTMEESRCAVVSAWRFFCVRAMNLRLKNAFPILVHPRYSAFNRGF